MSSRTSGENSTHSLLCSHSAGRKVGGGWVSHAVRRCILCGVHKGIRLVNGVKKDSSGHIISESIRHATFSAGRFPSLIQELKDSHGISQSAYQRQPPVARRRTYLEHAITFRWSSPLTWHGERGYSRARVPARAVSLKNILGRMRSGIVFGYNFEMAGAWNVFAFDMRFFVDCWRITNVVRDAHELGVYFANDFLLIRGNPRVLTTVR